MSSEFNLKLKEEPIEFRKETRVKAPFDKRNDDPSKSYGIGSLLVWWILVGPKGAVQFNVSFPTYLPHVEPEITTERKIHGFDVGYHSSYPMYSDQPSMECEHTASGICFYDGSGSQARDWVDEIFSIKGEYPEKRIWEKLEQEYMETFEGGYNE
jgi:hypothetical protein